MSILKLPKRFSADFSHPGTQPVDRVVVDRSNPMARGLVGVMHPGSGPVVKDPLGDLLRIEGFQGFRSGSTTLGSPWAFPSVKPCSVNAQHSVFILFCTRSVPANRDVLYSERPNSTQIFKLTIGSAGISYVYRNAGGGGLLNEPVITAYDTSKNIHAMCLVKAADNDRTLYVDDNLDTVTTSSGGAYNAVVPVIAGDPHDSSQPITESCVALVYTFNRALSGREYRSLQKDPYQLLVPANSAYGFWADSGGGSGVSVEIPTLDNSATTYAPVVSVSDHQSVEIPTSLHAITTYAPSVSIGDNVSVEIPSLDNSATTYAPIVSTTSNTVVTIPTSLHSITLYAPAVSVTAHVSVEIPTSLHKITTYAPIVQTIETPDLELNLSSPIVVAENLIAKITNQPSLPAPIKVETINLRSWIRIQKPVSSIMIQGDLTLYGNMQSEINLIATMRG